jgi:outer membrane protein insertion porin family
MRNGSVKKVIFIIPDDVFSPAQIDDICKGIRDIDGQSGYINTNMLVIKKSNIAFDKIDLEFSIRESGKCFVDEIEIHGNSKTKNHVILRELTLGSGDPFDPLRMKNRRARLSNARDFSDIDISSVNTQAPEKKTFTLMSKRLTLGKQV